MADTDFLVRDRDDELSIDLDALLHEDVVNLEVDGVSCLAAVLSKESGLEDLVLSYCSDNKSRSFEEYVKICLSAFFAPFAAKKAGKDPERVKALAEYSLRQLKAQYQLINYIFFKEVIDGIVEEKKTRISS